MVCIWMSCPGLGKIRTGIGTRRRRRRRSRLNYIQGPPVVSLVNLMTRIPEYRNTEYSLPEYQFYSMTMLWIKVDILCIYYPRIVCKVPVLRLVLVQGRFTVVVEVSNAMLGSVQSFYSIYFCPHLSSVFCGGGGRSTSCQPQLSWALRDTGTPIVKMSVTTNSPLHPVLGRDLAQHSPTKLGHWSHKSTGNIIESYLQWSDHLYHYHSNIETGSPQLSTTKRKFRLKFSKVWNNQEIPGDLLHPKMRINPKLTFMFSVIFIILVKSTRSQNYNKVSASSVNISNLLNSFQIGYDRRVRPNYGGIPVTVGVSLYILSIGDLSEKFMDFTFDMYFRQFWTDPRWGDVFYGWNLKASLGWPFRNKTI